MKFYYLIVLSLFLSFCGLAQETSFSPYSRFGIGELHGNMLNRQYSMGGSGTGMIDFLGVNPLNSASYAYITEPSFELGILSNWFKLESQSDNIDGNVTRINHVVLGMPITSKKMGFSFGLIPVSYIGYNINSTDSIGDFPYINENLGQGGLNKLYLGVGKRFIMSSDTVKFKNKEKTLYSSSLAVGFNFNYVFGNRTNIARTIFPQGAGAINTQKSKIDNTSDIALDFGILYSTWLKKRVRQEDGQIKFNIGLSLSPETQLATKRSEIVESFVSTSTIQFFVDSVFSNEDRAGFISLPQELSIGTSFEFFTKKDNRLILAMDYRTRAWGDYFEDFDGENTFDELVNSTRISAGLEYMPNWRLGIRGATIAPEDYLKSLHYRAGFFSSSGYLNLEGQEFTETGINFGVGLPLVRGRSKLTSSELNFGFEISQRGSLENNLLKENNFEVFVGIRFNPNMRLNPWFVKRKYD